MRKFKFLLFFLLLISPVFLINPLGISAQSCASSLPPAGTPALADSLITARSLNNTTYISASGRCITGDATNIFLEQSKMGFDTFDNLKKVFYEKSKFPTKATTLPSPLNFNGSTIYFITGDLNINSNPTGNGVIVIFVTGNLTINTNITYANSSSSSGLVFIVKGDVLIESGVTQVNAAFIAEGDICTSSVLGVCPAAGNYLQSQPLTINGSLISINQDTSENHIKFTRTLANNSTGVAETVNAQPKYLVILKDILASDLVVVSEK